MFLDSSDAGIMNGRYNIVLNTAKKFAQHAFRGDVSIINSDQLWNFNPRNAEHESIFNQSCEKV